MKNYRTSKLNKLSTFKDNEETYDRIDYHIISRGWCQLYYSNGALASDLTWLENEGYEVLKFSCDGLSNLLEEFRELFMFPIYFHHNFNSLNDCLRDIQIRGIGMVIVFKNFDRFSKDIMESLLNIFINLARQKFIVGKRLMILAQVNDKDFKAYEFGAIQVGWNSKEYVDHKRELNITQA